MKCPFDLPVKAEYSEMSDAHIVIDPHDRVVAYHCNDKSSAYIVHVINSHKKLVEALKKYGEHEPGCIKGDACNCGFEQALEGE